MNPIEKFDLISVDIGCNNNNGTFSGRVYSFHFMQECMLNTCMFDEDDDIGFIGTKIELGKNQIVLYKNLKSKRNIKIPVFKVYTCPATWTAETILISRESLANILNFLNEHSKEGWCMEEAYSEIFEKWQDSKKFNAKDFKQN